MHSVCTLSVVESVRYQEIAISCVYCILHYDGTYVRGSESLVNDVIASSISTADCYLLQWC